MIDIDYGPGVMASIIFLVLLLPTLYGLFLVDAYWKKNKESSQGKGEDVFM